MDKKIARIRRAQKTRATIKRLTTARLCVYRTSQHIYAQVLIEGGAKVVTSASTLDKEIKSKCSFGGNVNAATEVGKLVSQRALEKGIKVVAFDRSGYKYHGRIKALADAAREAGLEF
jgi:large subunit ribosomal protein L18